MGCKKSTKTTSPTLTSEATLCGLQFEHIYQVGLNKAFSGGDYIIFHANQTVSEWLPPAPIPGSITDTFHYSASLVFSNSDSRGLLQNGNAFKVQILSPYDSANKCSFYMFSFISYDTITLGTFISGNIVQNSQPTLGATNQTSSNYLVLTP